MWKTRITELFGIKYPIVEGAFDPFGNADLAVAVCEAGGLGMITANALRTPKRLRNEIRKLRSLTDKPFAVNLSPVPAPSLPPLREVALEERVPIIETAGSRALDHGRAIKQAGLIWIHKVHTLRHALSAQADGADAVTIMGLEGAGLKNPTMLPTFMNVSLSAKQVRIPIIAAGGIGDSRTFLAALALGAEAAVLGTVLCAVRECPLSERRKRILVEADPYDPAWRDRILTTPRLEDLKKLGLATDMTSFRQAAKLVEDAGLPKELGLPQIGLSLGFIDGIVTTKELIDGIIGGAETILASGGIGGWNLSSP